MKSKLIKLFIDESGMANPYTSQSELYILCGCAIKDEQRMDLRMLADQIKYKYWNRTDVVFHSRDIGKNEKDFAIFKNNSTEKANFQKDLYKLLSAFTGSIFIVIVDHNKAREKKWEKNKLYKETAKNLFNNFLGYLLLNKTHGAIVIESATANKDTYYLKAFSTLLSPNGNIFKANYADIQKQLTSISFVNKNNHDIEEQLADIFAYAAKCKYYMDSGIKNYNTGSYEWKIIRSLNAKLYKTPITLNGNKKKIAKLINPFIIIP